MQPYRQPVDRLGPMVREHRWKATTQMFVVAAIFFVPWLVPLFARNDSDTWDVWTWLMVGVFFLGMPAVGVYVIVTGLKLRTNVVRIHEHGFVHRWKGVETTVDFGDVSDIDSKVRQTTRNGIDGPVMHMHKVSVAGGKLLTITHGYEDVAELVAALQAGRKRAKHS